MNLKETLGEALNPNINNMENPDSSKEQPKNFWLKAEIKNNELKLMYGRHEVKIDEHSRLALKELIQRNETGTLHKS